MIVLVALMLMLSTIVFSAPEPEPVAHHSGYGGGYGGYGGYGGTNKEFDEFY